MYRKEYQKNTYKYRKEKQKKIEVSYKTQEYEFLIKPFAEEMDLPVATVIKLALNEYMERHADPEGQKKRLMRYYEAISQNKDRPEGE